MPTVRFLPASLLAIVLLIVSACGGDSNPTDSTPVPADLTAVQGDVQTGVVGGLLGNQLVVRVLDGDGEALAGVSITWTVSSGGGSVSPATSTTGSGGQASTAWTLGTTPGTQQVTARAGSLSTAFSATAEIGTADQVNVTPASETLTSFGETIVLAAEVRDAFGNVRADAVTWSSSDDAVATVDDGGTVTAVANGEATISASTGSASGSATITVAQQAATVTPSTGGTEVLEGNTVEVTVTAADANGNAVAGESFNWSVADESVATITPNSDGTSVTIAGVTEGSTTLSVAAGSNASATATVAVEVQPGELAPTEDGNIGGNVTVSSVNVPDGVTLTITDALDLTSQGDVTIGGSMTGDCVPIRISSAGSLTITGAVQNGCSDAQAAGGMLELYAAGSIEVNGVTVKPSGDLVISNDPANMTGSLASMLRSNAFRMGAANGDVDRSCTFRHFISEWIPLQAPAGTNGGNIRLYCNETMTLVGGNQLSAQWGGDAVAAQGVDIIAGSGGDGGGVEIQVVSGDIIFQNETVGGGQGTAVGTGFGGDGGDADASSDDPAVLARATAGAGGAGGLFGVNTNDGEIRIEGMGGLRIDFGDGGDGGDATALGADGLDAGTEPAEDGGNAEAYGGTGGSSGFGELLDTSGQALPTNWAAITGLTNIIQAGANGGSGGDASVTGGNGGNGNESFPNGADGGDMYAESGNGGSSLNGAGDAPLGMGGDAGDLSYAGGRGGHGASGCAADPAVAGGNGGFGGDGDGILGSAGTGMTDGADGAAAVADDTGNGGNGGDGDGPGAGGLWGEDDVPDGPYPNAFLPGVEGASCGGEPIGLQLDLSGLLSSPGALPAGTYTVPVSGGGYTGTVQFMASGQTFWSDTPSGGGPRLGFGNGGSITFDLPSIVLENAAAFQAQSIQATETTGASNQTLDFEVTQTPKADSEESETVTTGVTTNSSGLMLIETFVFIRYFILRWISALVFIDINNIIINGLVTGGG